MKTSVPGLDRLRQVMLFRVYTPVAVPLTDRGFCVNNISWRMESSTLYIDIIA